MGKENIMHIRNLTLGLCASLATIVAACTSTNAKVTNNGPFEYNEIYLPEHFTPEYRDLGLNNLDKDWGIWGHNLDNIIPEKPSKTIYARRNGIVAKEQFCFSSDKLFEYICDYVSNNYYSSDSALFAILPNDNAVVCQCEECIRLGNTPTDASPAVNNMLSRLAERFPAHTFFTSSYKTTQSAPEKPLASNTGVLISAIDYPLTASVNQEADSQFLDIIGQWVPKTGKVYIWDYVNNFDDYFTPFPVFSALQHRLKLYRDAGVKGIFLNGSGSDYSSLSRLKTLVLAEMLDNPDIDWRKTLRDRAKQLYPVTGDIIADFMIAQEDFAASKGNELPLYKGVATAVDSYLPKDQFVEFHEKLLQALPGTSGQERDDLTVLTRAMELTRLEIMRIDGNLLQYRTHLDNLKKIDSENNVNIYSEICWTVPSYAKDFEYIANRWSPSDDNKLKGATIKSMSHLDPPGQDESVLTDGVLGMPSNYHNGLVINSPDEKWRFSVPAVPGIKTIRVWFAVNPAFKFGLPKKLELTANDRLISWVKEPQSTSSIGHTFVDIDVPSYSSGPFVLTLVRDPDVRVMAVEEIEAF